MHRCLVCIDLNMAHAGIVKHLAERLQTINGRRQLQLVVQRSSTESMWKPGSKGCIAVQQTGMGRILCEVLGTLSPGISHCKYMACFDPGPALQSGVCWSGTGNSAVNKVTIKGMLWRGRDVWCAWFQAA